ncbi:MAG: type II CAAX prenyl endopeptidase Rce1 family protein [Steroidobacteraceae bacterium]
MRAFLWFLLLIAAALAAIAWLTYPAWLLLHPHFDFPFHRIGDRIGMLALLVGFLLVARHLKLADRASLGYGLARPVFLRELGLGAVLGVATMLAVVAAMWVLGLLAPSAESYTGAGLARLFVTRAGSALVVALIEETFLRGAMHTAIERESGTRLAVLLTAAVYATSHFLTSYHIAASEVTPASGVALLAGSAHALAHPLAVADAFLALFAVGVVLGGVRARTGNIAACLGLHAGWVWVMLVAHELTQPDRSAALAFLLSRFDGFVGWLVLGWTVLLAVPLWRFYARRGARAAAG